MTVPRYEIKIPCDPQRLPQVRAWVRLHPAHWRIAYPPRQVNNIYFDTLDCQSLNDNLGGAGVRSKLRLRWYGPDLDVVTGARLELKQKRGAVGWKEFGRFGGTLDLAHSPWPDIRQSLRETADHRAGLWLTQFTHPALINHYWREYYVAAGQTVRLTIDTRLRAYAQRSSGRPNLHRPAPIAARVIIELKAPVDRPSYERLAEILAHFPLRPDRHSKYVHGMLAAAEFDGVELS